jgi:hypothetical protein
VAARKWDNGLTEMMQHTGNSAEQGYEMMSVLLYHVIIAVTGFPNTTVEDHVENAIFVTPVIFNLILKHERV